MKKIGLLILIFLLLPLFCYAQAINITTIDVSQRLGRVPKIFSSSIWVQGLHNLFNTYILKKFFTENKPTSIQWTLRMLRHSKDFNDFKRKLKRFFQAKKAAFLLNKIRENNILLIVGFDPGCMPYWLSSQAGNKRKAFRGQGWIIEPLSPPKDYEKWAEVVEYTLRYLYERMDIKHLGFYVGHEPEWLWLGTKEEFFKYYEYAAKAAKRVSKDIKVGGIGLGWIKAKMKADPSDRPLLKEFLEYVARHHIPLDFINWHAFGIFPVHFIPIAKDIYQWIEEVGLSEKNIFLYPSDWTFWNPHYGGYPVDYLDTEQIAAYIPTALYYMYKAGIKYHGHDFDVRDPGFERKIILKRSKSTFIGNWALFTPDGVIKPSYNVFRVVSLLNLKKSDLILASSDTQITVIASANKERANVLLSNFVPIGKMRFIFLWRKLKNKKEFSAIKEELKFLKNKLKGKKDKEILTDLSSLIEKAKNKEKRRALEMVYKEVENYIESEKTPKKIILYFKNLPFQGKVLLTTYTIDKNHSNSCRFNKRTEPLSTKTSCGIGGKIDRLILQAKQEAKKAAIERIGKLLLEKGFSKKQIMKMEQCFELEHEKVRRCLKKIKGIDKKALLKALKKEYQRIYWAKIDQINTLKEVSLEGSKDVQLLNIENGKCRLSLEMLPNSIWLVILEKLKKQNKTLDRVSG